jgi:hypothetical protein
MIVYSGSEVGSNRTLLSSMGVKVMGLNYFTLKKRGMPKTKTWYIDEHYPRDVQVFVESGATQVDKANFSKADIEEYAAEYQEFLVNNSERALYFLEFDSQVMGQTWVEQQRPFFEYDPKFVVVWHKEYGTQNLRDISGIYKNVAIPNDEIEEVTNLASITRACQFSSPVKYHALATAKPEIPFETASTLAWTRPMRSGETIIWDGTRLVRYPKKMKDQSRPRYKSVVEKAGLDFEKFKQDDIVEAAKVAVWSYQQLEKVMDKKTPDLHIIEGGKVSDNFDTPLMTGLMELGIPHSDNSAVEVRKNSAPEVLQRDASEQYSLPVFGYQLKTIVDQDETGRDVLKDVPIVQSQAASLRQCDTCFVASNCPAFKPQHVCAFNLPIEVKTKEQLKSLLTSIVEMQGQRVAFMRFAEEMNGGYADPNTSNEIDRLLKLVGEVKKLEENRDYIKITAERSTSGGVLSAIFGDKVQAMRELENPIGEAQTTKIIQQSLE